MSNLIVGNKRVVVVVEFDGPPGLNAQQLTSFAMQNVTIGVQLIQFRPGMRVAIQEQQPAKPTDGPKIIPH